MKWFDTWRAARHIRSSSYRVALRALPAGLETSWRHSAPDEYQGIPTDAFFFARAAEGLMNFFDVVTRSGKPCALPSEAADSVWHTWLRWNPAALDYFCIEHFGRRIPHVERSGLAAGALLNTYAACHALRGKRPRTPCLPPLFRLDARLRMPGGHGYWRLNSRILYARMSVQGRGFGRATPHPELTTAALYMAGQADRQALAAELGRRRATQDSGHIQCGSDGGIVLLDGGGDAGGGDGGGDGGSSCGSSCGGCGGGGGD